MKTIQLTRGQVALVDDEDYESLKEFNWCATKAKNTYYATRAFVKPDGKRTNIFMHQFLCGKGTDHIDGNGLNNQRNNLRLASKQQNSWNQRVSRVNKSGFKGVSWNARRKKWLAQMNVNGTYFYLGDHATPEEAARAYDNAARKHQGEYARLNFPLPGERSARQESMPLTDTPANGRNLIATNTSGFRGIYWNRRIRKWIARIGVKRKTVQLGAFVKPEDAARAYDNAVIEFGLPLSRLNFPEAAEGRLAR